MKLYLSDKLLQKAAGQTPNVSKYTPTEEQSTVENDSSYGRRYEGVAAGEAMDPDDPEVGSKWKKDDSSSVSKETGQKLSKKGLKKADEEDKEIAKSLSAVVQEPMDMLKSFTSGLRQNLEAEKLNPREIEFLVDHVGYDYNDVVKGKVLIKGRLRDEFTDWLCSRLPRSTNEIVRR